LENVPNLHAEIRQVAEGAQDKSDPSGRLGEIDFDEKRPSNSRGVDDHPYLERQLSVF
jgi:hypothetical protein